MRRANDERTLPLRLRAGVEELRTRWRDSGSGYGSGKASGSPKTIGVRATDTSRSGGSAPRHLRREDPPSRNGRNGPPRPHHLRPHQPSSGQPSSGQPSSGQPSSDQRPASQRHHRHHRHSHRRRLYVLVALGVVLLLFFIPIVGAATTPGNEDFKSKYADWLRSHHLSALVTPIEQWYYNDHAPSKGGQPKSLNALPGAGGGTVPVTVGGPGAGRSEGGGAAPTTFGTIPVDGRTTPTTAPRITAPEQGSAPTTLAGRPASGTGTGTGGVAHLPTPSPVPLVVSPSLPGEGQWLPVGPVVHGVRGMYEAQFRADNVYTSQITSAVWIDPTLLRVSLVPGAQEPGGTWPETPDLVGQAALHAAAAFNGGFRFQDAHGGFYLAGREAVPLQADAASMVIYDNGRINVGTWDHEVSMTPHVVAVLQNLVPIVDNGQPAPSATYQDSAIWGATLGAQTVIARSGIGVTPSGGLVYVAGPALTAKSLAESLQRAGAVRAMALDLNPEWVTFNFFSHDAAGNVSGTKLYPEQQRPADRYLGPSPESRDFFVVSDPG